MSLPSLSLPRLLRKNSFILTLLGLSLLITALSEAKADVKGIPYTPDFATALFPYARTVAGCTEWRKPSKVGDHWGSVSFAGACQAHDQCFHTLGAHWGDCNQRYLEDLRASCDRDLKADKLESRKGGEPDAQALSLCYEIAGLYFAKAQERGSTKRFELAQSKQAEYLRYVRGVIRSAYQETLLRKATTKEEDRAFAALRQGYSLDDLKSALMGARMDAEGDDGRLMPASIDTVGGG